MSNIRAVTMNLKNTPQFNPVWFNRTACITSHLSFHRIIFSSVLDSQVMAYMQLLQVLVDGKETHPGLLSVIREVPYISSAAVRLRKRLVIHSTYQAACCARQSEKNRINRTGDATALLSVRVCNRTHPEVDQAEVYSSVYESMANFAEGIASYCRFT